MFTKLLCLDVALLLLLLLLLLLMLVLLLLLLLLLLLFVCFVSMSFSVRLSDLKINYLLLWKIIIHTSVVINEKWVEVKAERERETERERGRERDGVALKKGFKGLNKTDAIITLLRMP